MRPKETDGRKGDGGEWVEVRRRNFQVNKIITSFYVSNLQDDVTNAMLKEAFHSFGNLVDVYIPGRKDKAGSFFAFIKYKGVLDAAAMARTLDGVRCGQCITKVNVSKFEKKPIHRPGMKFVNKSQPPKMPFSGWNKIRDDRSFADVVGRRNNSSKVHPPPVVSEIKLSQVLAMERSCNMILLGEVTSFDLLNDLPNLLNADGCIPCQVFFAGGLKLGFNEELKFERQAWVKIIGLPIHLGSDANVTSIVSSLGKILEVDGQNWRCINLASAHARILTASKKLINEEVCCTFNGKSFCIGIVECVDVWEPFSKYNNSNDCSPDPGNMEDLEDDVVDKASSDEDDDGISDTWCENFHDLEEGEIGGNSGEQNPITDGNDDVRRQSTTAPISVIPDNVNAILNAEHEKSSGTLDSKRSADFVHVGPTIPFNSPLPPDGLLPNSLAQINGDPDPLLDAPITISGVGESKSKKRKLDRSTFNIPAFSLPPRRLSTEFGISPNRNLVSPTLAGSFDLNISIPNPSATSNLVESSSDSSNIIKSPEHSLFLKVTRKVIGSSETH
ncbi:unnamed protein product [Lactuca virosa]|uniref:RRM domain-containing protein n=1 Tax=Lactuca virosa TaxID=75947 RepID=A0AAU9PSR6_9ASTR|nr:unnamed protein product [Lactuca virosa]